MKEEIINALEYGTFYGFVYDKWNYFTEDEKREMILNLYYNASIDTEIIKTTIEDLKERL